MPLFVPLKPLLSAYLKALLVVLPGFALLRWAVYRLNWPWYDLDTFIGLYGAAFLSLLLGIRLGRDWRRAFRTVHLYKGLLTPLCVLMLALPGIAGQRLVSTWLFGVVNIDSPKELTQHRNQRYFRIRQMPQKARFFDLDTPQNTMPIGGYPFTGYYDAVRLRQGKPTVDDELPHHLFIYFNVLYDIGTSSDNIWLGRELLRIMRYDTRLDAMQAHGQFVLQANRHLTFDWTVAEIHEYSVVPYSGMKMRYLINLEQTRPYTSHRDFTVLEAGVPDLDRLRKNWLLLFITAQLIGLEILLRLHSRHLREQPLRIKPLPRQHEGFEGHSLEHPLARLEEDDPVDEIKALEDKKTDE